MEPQQKMNNETMMMIQPAPIYTGRQPLENLSDSNNNPFNGDDFSPYSQSDDPTSLSTLLKSLLWLVYALSPLCLIIYLLSNYSAEQSISETLLSQLQSLPLIGSSSEDTSTTQHKQQSFYSPDLPSTYTESHKLDSYNIEFYDLLDYKSTAEGWNNGERILFCVPLRDAAPHLDMFFSNLMNITYPHNLIDIAFLISDTKDTTMKDLKRQLKAIQSLDDSSLHFGRINIYEKDFGQIIGQSFSDRHGFQAQGPRRKLMAIARNWLLTTALRPDHSWVYWRDIDVETVPPTVIEDLMHHDKDVIVPNIWRPLPDWLGYEQPYDLNSWQESEGGLDLADKLDEDAVIVEGYAEYATWRPHLAYMRDPFGDPEVEMELDGIGGVSILTKADVFKSGAMFPAFSYLKHAETEGFGKLCKTMNYSVIGLPHYTIWHIYEPSSDDLRHMEWMAEEEMNKLEKARLQKIYNKIWTKAFERVDTEWEALKFNVFKNTDLKRHIDIDWSEVDEYLEATLMGEDDEFGSDGAGGSRAGVNRHGEIFDSFQMNSYIGGKNYKFVKFKDINSNAQEDGSGSGSGHKDVVGQVGKGKRTG
ncbi:unnamed protein product [Ambrosiozyma monospora]|uniref:Unnamed protein product n=1 Tax=Ambrosiozyma monospora TaxID=43982 RepID=A0A9W6Z6X3_AMBMO|nr:unnamed protein product [Ambrosiozyma monospora]